MENMERGKKEKKPQKLFIIPSSGLHPSPPPPLLLILTPFFFFLLMILLFPGSSHSQEKKERSGNPSSSLSPYHQHFCVFVFRTLTFLFHLSNFFSLVQIVFTTFRWWCSHSLLLHIFSLSQLASWWWWCNERGLLSSVYVYVSCCLPVFPAAGEEDEEIRLQRMLEWRKRAVTTTFSKVSCERDRDPSLFLAREREREIFSSPVYELERGERNTWSWRGKEERLGIEIRNMREERSMFQEMKIERENRRKCSDEEEKERERLTCTQTGDLLFELE